VGESREIFISHSSSDRAIARELRRHLEADGPSCWLAPDDVRGAVAWARQILSAVDECRAMIVLVSERANASEHVSREVTLALGRGKPVLPIRIEAVGPEGALEYLLSLVQWIDAFPPPISDHLPDVSRHVAALLDRSGTASPGTAIAARAAPAQAVSQLVAAAPLPVPLAGLVGRLAELDELERLLRGNRLVTITGPGGVGKTRLAIEAARRVGAGLGGAAFVDLSAIRDPTLVPEALRSALDLAIDPAESAADVVVRALASEGLLLVLDNLEQILPAAAFLSRLSAAAPGVRLFGTSRAPLGIRGEQEFALGPLHLPEPGQDSVEQLADNESVRLFMEESRRHSSTALSSGNAGVVAEICRRLDGLPLAIELVAGRSRSMSFATMLARLERRLEISGTDLDLPERQRTLRAAIAWSSDMLKPDVRAVFARASVFVGGFTAASAAAVAGPAASDEALDQLVRHSLVTHGGDHDRFSMLETIREFAQAELAAEGELDATRDRAAAWLVELLEGVEADYVQAHDRAAALDRAEAERNNVRELLAWAAANGRDEVALRLASAKNFWAVRGGVLEGLGWLRELVDRPADYSTRALAQGLTAFAGLAANVGQLAVARTRFEAALPLWQELGERRTEARVENNLGIVSERLDDLERARGHLDRALALMRHLDDRQGVASVIGNLGILAHRLEDWETAEQCDREALEIARELGDELTMSIASTNLANIALRRDDLAGARAHCAESLRLAHRLDDVEGIIICLETFAQIAGREGDAVGQVRLLAGAGRWRAAAGFAAYPSWESELDAMITSARAHLGDEEFERCWTEGAAMEPDALRTLALGETAPAGRQGSGQGPTQSLPT
jgi:predicted ATPase